MADIWYDFDLATHGQAILHCGRFRALPHYFTAIISGYFVQNVVARLENSNKKPAADFSAPGFVSSRDDVDIPSICPTCQIVFRVIGIISGTAGTPVLLILTLPFGLPREAFPESQILLHGQ